jgi:hypothetical protein
MKCEHWGWKMVTAHFSNIKTHDWQQNYILMKCSGCGAFWCLDFAPGEIEL